MASSLALIEKRNQRTGNGCVGIFSQLFDWNKKFTKKKLFPKKLHPPVSVKKASKVYGSDEKQPKLLLIADENSGGFPCMKNNGGICHVKFETNHGTQVPGLIARLMGLESLPAVKKDKLKKVPKPETLTDKNPQKCVDRNEILERGGFGVQNMETKNESRPQKLQKTGLSDKRPVSKLEVEAFESKNVLSRSRKHNHKSVSQARNPGNLSSKSTSRLEPGLPSKRSNCAINYTKSSMLNPKIKDHPSESSKDLPQDSYVKSSSCKSCDEQPYGDIIVKQMYSCHKQHKATTFENNVCNEGPLFRVQGERQTFKGRKIVPSRSKLSNLQSDRVPSVNITKNDTRRSTIVSTKTEYCESHVRKRGSDHISGKIEPRFSKPSYIRSSLISERDTNGSNHSHVLEQPQESASYCIGDRQNQDISSSIKSQIADIDTELDEKVENKTCSHEFSLKRTAFHEDGGIENMHEYYPLDDDNLGALLQEKLRELTSHEDENESVYEDTSSRKTVAVILQELIFALTKGKPHNPGYVTDELPKNPSYFHNRVQSKMTSLTASQHHEHFSPESVLDGSFSNESSNFYEETDHIISSSLFRDSITFLTRHISEALSSIDLANNLFLRGKKLDYAKEIILNAEMVFGNASTTLNDGFSICNLIQNELETIVARFHGLMGSNSNTTENRHHHHQHHRNYSQLKGFVFDCVIEYLESRFSRYSNTGFNVWSRLPLRMKTEMLTCEIVEEVGRWIYMSGLSCTELIDYEMSYKLGKWTNFDLEAFETGADVDHLILESLIDELIVDVYKV